MTPAVGATIFFKEVGTNLVFDLFIDTQICVTLD